MNNIIDIISLVSLILTPLVWGACIYLDHRRANTIEDQINKIMQDQIEVFKVTTRLMHQQIEFDKILKNLESKICKQS